MRLPWVSRRLYESALEAKSLLERQLDALTAGQRALQQAYTELVNKLVELKRVGFEIPPDYGEPVTSAASLPDEVVDAMEMRARRNTPLWHELARYAEAQLRENADVEEIREEILVGGELPL